MLTDIGDTHRLREARIIRLPPPHRTFFFIAIHLRICGGGSAPHFAADATLRDPRTKPSYPMAASFGKLAVENMVRKSQLRRALEQHEVLPPCSRQPRSFSREISRENGERMGSGYARPALVVHAHGPRLHEGGRFSTVP
jgi:hypothetical protein